MPNVSPLKYPDAMTIRVDQEFRDAVDELRRGMNPVPTKSEAIRIVVLRALNDQKKGRKRNGR